MLLPKREFLPTSTTTCSKGRRPCSAWTALRLPFENDAINKMHPVNVKMSTLHTPNNFASGEMGGNRLDPYHRSFTATEAVSSGAVAMGRSGFLGHHRRNVREESAARTADLR